MDLRADATMRAFATASPHPGRRPSKPRATAATRSRRDHAESHNHMPVLAAMRVAMTT